ncbi:hypothetical protein FAM09_29525 [Niastella caeni]|uniref:histidine kinase n=1 Tax=Niastella caeni TaxID=2569763 RepID=A0A4S8H7T2_9BACT|nr:histidine kinase dimerization/phospho-acceptor domain-containing protein [Niastella caeni]THU30743.1 hypothetical protein FAM09_29525 [Niastella caeni]
MGRRSTRLKIIFFSVLLLGFIFIQYSWVKSLQKEKLDKFRSNIALSIHEATKNIPINGPLHQLTDSTINNTLRRSFASQGLGNIHFEFSIGSANNRLASHGFTQKLTHNTSNLTWYYEFLRNGEKSTSVDRWTIVIPDWEKYALKNMPWIIAASVLLTIMIMAILWGVVILSERSQQLFYDRRAKVIKYMMQQLETPLSTISVAAEALRNARVMHDSGKTKYYQQVINEENKRMNEQVEKMLRELK